MIFLYILCGKILCRMLSMLISEEFEFKITYVYIYMYIIEKPIRYDNRKTN